MPRKASANRLISASHSWGEFFAAVAALPTDADKGEAFERLTELYLKTKPEYVTKLAHVWRVGSNLPPKVRKNLGLPNRDEGIDLVAETKDGQYWAIQCKFRADADKALTYRELSTFTSLAFHSCRGISEAVVAHTSAKPVKKRALLPQTTEIGLERWLQTTPEDWRRIHALLGGRPQRPRSRKPRPHQRKAIAAATAHFLKNKATRGRMIMPCGTGKSLTAFWIANALKARKIVVAVPSLALIKQSLEDWTREFVAQNETPVPEWLCVCSDESVGNMERDEFVSGVYDLGIPATTNEAEIAAFLSRRTRNRKIVFVTYQSSEKLAAGAKRAKASFDLAILDEAHKTVGVESKVFATLLFDAKVLVKQRIFMTATERVYRGSSDDVLSMDDESRYGQRFYQLTFKEAIDANIIADYKILTVAVTDEQIEALIRENRLITGQQGEVEEQEAQALAAGIALARAVKKHGVRHAISFHRSIRSAREFADQQAALVESGYLRPRVTNLHISSKKTAGQRAQLLDEFKAESRALMTNARCLTEGVDVPAIDCVLFADPKQSVIDIVQAAGRALRPYEGKPCGYIMLPLIVPKDMEFDEFAETTAFRQIAKTITALSTQDERIAVQFRTRSEGRRSEVRVVEFEGDIQVGRKIDLASFVARIEAQIWRRVGRANWRRFEEAREFVRGLKLAGQAEWNAYIRSDQRPPDIPTGPHVVYANSGWRSLGDWLGTGRVANRDMVFLPYEEARAVVRAANLKGDKEWRCWIKANKELGIPSAPWDVYPEEWAEMRDWLGHDYVATSKRRYLPYEEAKAVARALADREGINGFDDWMRAAKEGKVPDGVPLKPSGHYKGAGWTTWRDFLGRGKVFRGSWRPFEEARAFIRELGLKNLKEWQRYAKRGARPADIPSSPATAYAGKGWISLGDWLGTGAVAAQLRQFRAFDEARAFAKSLGLKGNTAWRVWAKSDARPADIPASPDRVYASSGWGGWGHWLGTGSMRPGSARYRSFGEARAFARSLGLRSGTEWRAWTKTTAKPADIPANPNVVYANDGWVGMGDWLGTGNIRPGRIKYRPFQEARAYARTLGLNSVTWRAWSKSDARPFDIPASPERIYRGRGWISWPDWLGTA